MPFQLPCLLSQLSNTKQSLFTTKKLQALVTRTNLSLDPFYATKLIRLYGLNHCLSHARKLFDNTPQRTVYLWNSMIRSYAQAHRFRYAFGLFSDMLSSEIQPDKFTFACLARACSDNYDIKLLRLVHGVVVVFGYSLDLHTSSALVTAYSKMGLVDEARKVFDGVHDADLVLWNSMIWAYGNLGEWGKGLELFRGMRRTGKQPDGYTMAGLISGLADCNLLRVGERILGLCLKCGFGSNAHVCSLLMSMYARYESPDSVSRVFDTLCQPDLVTWSALITGLSQSGECEKALLWFKKMNMEGWKADSVLAASVLSAVGQLSIPNLGSELHGYVVRHGHDLEVMVSSALIDMYSKCGFVWLGIRVFETMPTRNVVSYNSAILGLGLHGFASEALEMFEKLQKECLKPDAATFSSLLCACCHAGLVGYGRQVFRRMSSEFRIQARTEHYVYMVKLLGMAGELEEAYSLILSMQQPEDLAIWGALLSCCDYLGNTRLAEIVSQRISKDKLEKGAYSVMLSNIYAGDGNWHDSKRIRDNMGTGKCQKYPGLSWIKESFKH